MSYDGKVKVGGPAQGIITSKLNIYKIAVGPLDNNAYLLRNRVTGESLLIDAANEAPRLLELCDSKLDSILTTHCHVDHWLALEEVVAATGATTHAPAPEVPEIGVTTDVVLGDGDVVKLGDAALQIVLLRGHRANYLDHVSTSAAVIYRDLDGSTRVFSGDCLFPGGIGNTCEDPVAYATLLNDVTSKLFAVLPDDAVIHPGHGFDSTIGAERPKLGEWLRPVW
ncbi:MAG: MBL fold metallo-hydrolase [Actinobacteria bacterium]|nr:MBL fold metallo-hydrolase [Actinomycetota bacterium]